MGVATPNPNIGSEKIGPMELPIIDLMAERSEVAKLIVKASEEFGFFKVINHGVPQDIITKIEDEGSDFFAKPGPEKQRAGPADPYGYGFKNIGRNGDTGEVEYLLLHTNPLYISQKSNTISNDPTKFSSTVNGYIEAVRGVASKILELMAEGLWVPDTSVFSRLIWDVDSDSYFRINHYLPLQDADTSSFPNINRIGFGEHSDPQILTVLRSNDVGGLQIYLQNGMWVPVTPDPTAFCVFLGDLLQAMTNGRFVSVRHRAMANLNKSRMSMAYFGGPPLHASISSLPELVSPQKPILYRPFTWAEYKKVAYSLRLDVARLSLFKLLPDDETLD